MSEITKHRVGELLRGVFQILARDAEVLPVREVPARMEQVVPPTPFEASEYPSRPGVRWCEQNIRFKTIGPVKAGWLTKAKGTWALTDEGRRAYAQFTDPERFYGESDRLY